MKSAYVLGSEAWEDILEGCSKTLCLVYGSLGYMANMLTFTSISFSECLWGSEGCRRRGW